MSKPAFGDGDFEFGRWETPFENAGVWIEDVIYDRKSLVVRVSVYHPEWGSADPADSSGRSEPRYRVRFADVAGFRVLDEGGLLELWEETSKRGGRPGHATFRVRNHRWVDESFLTFFHGNDDGWSFVIATDGDCVEVVAQAPPEIALERQ